MRTWILVLAAMLPGCAMTYDTLQVGPNRYQVSAVAAPARGGIAGAQERATEAAAKKCVDAGKSLNVLNVDTGHEFPAAGRAIVTFECT
jgi:hypothetical protein